MPRDDPRVLHVLCSFSNAVYGLFVIGFVLLSLTLLSLLNPHLLSPAGQVVACVNLALVGTLLISSGYLLYRCQRL
jgi:hypothetical protein